MAFFPEVVGRERESRGQVPIVPEKDPGGFDELLVKRGDEIEIPVDQEMFL
jgi:hypothetical protein